MKTLSTSEPPVSADYAQSAAAPMQGEDWSRRLEQIVAELIAESRPRALAPARQAEPSRTGSHCSVLDEALLKLSEVQPADTDVPDLKALCAQSPIERALQKSSAAHIKALSRAGLDAPIVDLLRSWVEVIVDARTLQRQLEFQRLAQAFQPKSEQQAVQTLGEDPVAALTAAELGAALGGLGDETVRQRERAGKLFSILRPGRKRGREYPAFQAWPEVAGEALESTLVALGGAGGTAAYGFFTSPTDLLGGLTPIETLIGRLTSTRAVAPESRSLLAAPAAARREAVLQAARAHAAQISA